MSVNAYRSFGATAKSSTHRRQAEPVSPNPSIERTFQRPLRALCAAAHVELHGLPRFVKRHGVGMRIAKRLIH